MSADFIKATLPNGKWCHRPRTVAEEINYDLMRMWQGRKIKDKNERKALNRAVSVAQYLTMRFERRNQASV